MLDSFDQITLFHMLIVWATWLFFISGVRLAPLLVQTTNVCSVDVLSHSKSGSLQLLQSYH